jgi:hypothetical protein
MKPMVVIVYVARPRLHRDLKVIGPCQEIQTLEEHFNGTSLAQSRHGHVFDIRIAAVAPEVVRPHDRDTNAKIMAPIASHEGNRLYKKTSW